MPFLKKRSYNLTKPKSNKKNSEAVILTGIKEKDTKKNDKKTENKFRSSIKIRFSSYAEGKKNKK